MNEGERCLKQKKAGYPSFFSLPLPGKRVAGRERAESITRNPRGFNNWDNFTKPDGYRRR